MTSSSLRQQNLMYLANQTEGEREATTQPLKSMIEGSDIVGDFLHVIEGNAWDLGVFIEQQIGERGLRSLDLGRQHGLLADVGIEEEIEVREGGHPIESSNRLIRFSEDSLQRGQIESPSVGRQRCWNERLDSFTGHGGGHIPATTDCLGRFAHP
jgi:hypothetical protein